MPGSSWARGARAVFAAAGAALVALVLPACGAGGGGADPTSAAPPAGISAERCAANRAAGPVTYLTGYGFGGSVSILDAVSAGGQGYYDAVCLDVTVRPGGGTQNAQLVSAGTAQLGGLGGPSDVLTAVANGARVTSVATYGNTSAITLLTVGDTITDLHQLEGRTLGYKGALPPQVRAMLVAAGVDVSRVRTVAVGFDPTILARGQVDALTAYKSNEPLTLRAAGVAVREWDPERYGVRSAFNSVVANADWAREHPTAVQDFLRATFAGFAWTDANVDAAVARAAELAGGAYDTAANARQWRTESALVRRTLVPGHGIGWQSTAQWEPELQALQRFGLLRRPVDLAAVVDPAPVAAIYRGRDLVWPPGTAAP